MYTVHVIPNPFKWEGFGNNRQKKGSDTWGGGGGGRVIQVQIAVPSF